MLIVGTAAYDSSGSCTSACQNSSMRRFRLLYIPVGCLYLASSFARRKTYINKTQQDIKQYNNRFTTLAHYVHIPCETNTYSITIAVRGIVKLFRLVKHEKELY
jgi:hypothetical protein